MRRFPAHRPRRAPRLAATLMALLAVTAPVAMAQPQDDAGSGGDAPGSWTAALDVAPGTLRGVLHPDGGDVDDWYRMAVVERDLVRIAVAFDVPTESWFLEVRRDDGSFIMLVTSDEGLHATFEASPGMRIGVRAGEPAETAFVGYALTLEPRHRPDLAIALLEVSPDDLDLDDPFERRIIVVVENHGQGVAENASLYISLRLSTPARFCYQTLLGADLDLAPGKNGTFAVIWNTFGYVGDVEVEASASVRFEPSDRRADNRLSTEVTLVAWLFGWGTAVSCLP